MVDVPVSAITRRSHYVDKGSRGPEATRAGHQTASSGLAAMRASSPPSAERLDGCSPLAAVQAAGVAEQQQTTTARGTPCSSASGPSQLAYEAGSGDGSSGGGSHHAHAGGGLDSGTRTLSDVIDWTINLPWQKAFSWVVVAVAASQLRDFFGVRAPAAAAGRQPCSGQQCAYCLLSPLP